MSTDAKITTADELLHMASDGCHYELLEGELLMMSPSGSEHAIVIGEITWRLGQFIHQHHLGGIFGAEAGFLVTRNPDTVLAPDVAFARKEQLDTTGIPKAFFPAAPALVIEVVSPNDTVEQVDDKMRRWLISGVELAWVVHPAGRTVTVYRSIEDIRVLTENDTLTGNGVVPGFECRVCDLFARLVRNVG
jgi:Uma2 family endonuclease